MDPNKLAELEKTLDHSEGMASIAGKPATAEGFRLSQTIARILQHLLNREIPPDTPSR